MNKIFLIFMSTIVVFCTACSSNIQSPKSVSNPYIGKDISAYLRGKYLSVNRAKEKLSDAGFEVLATYSPLPNGTTIVFTNAVLKAQALKFGRPNAAVLRLFVDDKMKRISFTNPIYFGKAFMQDNFNYKAYTQVLEAIYSAFPELIESKDKMKFEDLASYHFMVGMPYYQNQDVLAEGSTSELLAKAKKYKDGKYLVFTLKLSDDAYLLGYELHKKTKKFIKQIGRSNAAILPWTISIEHGKAKALNAKYYVAVSYPLLTMNDFMGIATVPGTITKELEKVFR